MGGRLSGRRSIASAHEAEERMHQALKKLLLWEFSGLAYID
jgi:hypothetical protein